jgi:signal transduction histidine kinase
MTLWPQSLFGRLLTAVLGAVVVAMFVMVLLVLQDRRTFVVRNDVQDMSRRIADITRTLEPLDKPSRDTARLEMNVRPRARGELLMLRAGGRGPPAGELAKTLANDLRGQLGASYTVSVHPADPAVRNVIRVQAGMMMREGRMRAERGRGPLAEIYDVAVQLPDGDRLVYRVATAKRSVLRFPLPAPLLRQVAILAVLLGIVLFLMTRSITKPLSHLASAADAVGRGLRHPPLEEKGARELRHAARAFNTMQDRLRRYLDSRTRVLAAMSHDLKTPLTRMRLRVESLEDPAVRARFGNDLDEMESMVRGALGVLKGLDNDEPAEPVDIDALLASLQSGFAEMGAQVHVQGKAREPITAQPQALRRCLTNLLDNAIKFGERATVWVEDGDALTIRVRDDGPGIPPEQLERVFEPFYRLEASRNRDTGGTGLGLSIARDVAQGHGGTLVLHNLPRRGLEAVLTLPRSQRRGA